MTYYIAPRFLDKLSIHITKNYIGIPGVKVPLILGIHGRKGEGKSFQCELVFQRMGIEAVRMSAGELEGPDAGDPARLVRLRYREAAEMVKVRGKMAVLMINDIDAGMGRVDERTQYTVNTQLVAGTLMNIADNPTDVQLPGSYDSQPIQRIPILVTGNDFATLYAPMIRDGRMEKFYWEPDRSDRGGIVGGIFEQDGVSRQDVEALVDTFPDQSIDFYSALHSRLYDEQIRQFIQSVGIEQVSKRLVNSKEDKPTFAKPDFSLSRLIELGDLIVREQQRIQELRLSQSYVSPYQGTAPANARHSSASPADTLVSGSTDQSVIPNGHTSNGHPGNDYSQRVKSQTGQSQTGQSQTGQSPNDYSRADRSSLSREAWETLKGLLLQGLRVGIEYVDERRFRTNSWMCYSVIQAQDNERDAIALVDTCLQEHANDYVRLVGIQPSDRRRVAEVIIHRPLSHASGRN